MAANGFDDIEILTPAEPIAQWQVGDVVITKVAETEMRRSVAASLPNADVDELAALPWLHDELAVLDGTIRFSFHALVIETNSDTIIVDTCFGNGKQRPGMAYCDGLDLPFLERLSAAGYAPGSIDAVVCTHFHSDHVGWNTRLVDDRWTPTFHNADHLFPDAELSYWKNRVGTGEDSFDPMLAAYTDSVLPVVDAGLVRPVTSDHRVCDEVRLLPTPGHTPGHVSVIVESRGEYALITGDAIHHPGQLADPTWSSGFDADPELAHRIRRSLLDTAVDTRALVIGTHWSSAGLVAREGHTFRLNH